jgi:hypothetical protein
VLQTPSTLRFTPLELWGELSRRGIDIERIAAGGLTASIALSVALHITLLKLSDADILMQPDPPRGSGATSWTQVLNAWHEDRINQGTTPRRGRPEYVRSLVESLIPWVTAQDVGSLIESHPEVVVAFSKIFTDKVAEWLAHLIADDLEKALRAEAPAPELFLGIRPRRDRDELGLWLWERFTVTAVDSWNTSSLLLEWSSNPVEGNELCPPRAMAERMVPREQVGVLALERASESRSREPLRRGLAANFFTEDAMERLLRGDWKTASKIFGGLVDLRPADGEAWNNLGFCQLAGDPGEALETLQRAAVLPLVPTLICQANRVLALHLLQLQHPRLLIPA